MQQLQFFITQIGGLISSKIFFEKRLNTEAKEMYYQMSARKGKMRLLYNSYIFLLLK